MRSGYKKASSDNPDLCLNRIKLSDKSNSG